MVEFPLLEGMENRMQSVTSTGFSTPISVPVTEQRRFRFMSNAQKVEAEAQKPVLTLVCIFNVGLAPVLAQRIYLHCLFVQHFNRSV